MLEIENVFESEMKGITFEMYIIPLYTKLHTYFDIHCPAKYPDFRLGYTVLTSFEKKDISSIIILLVSFDRSQHYVYILKLCLRVN